MNRLSVLTLSVCLLSSCAVLDRAVDVFDPTTGLKTGETTVGSIIADSGEAVGDAAGSIIGGVTGNPLLGTGAAAAIAGLFMGARRKRKLASSKSTLASDTETEDR